MALLGIAIVGFVLLATWKLYVRYRYAGRAYLFRWGPKRSQDFLADEERWRAANSFPAVVNRHYVLREQFEQDSDRMQAVGYTITSKSGNFGWEWGVNVVWTRSGAEPGTAAQAITD